MMRTLHLDAQKLRPWEIGARLLAALAFPGLNELEDQIAVATAICTDQLLTEIKHGSNSADDLRAVFPNYTQMTSRDIAKVLRRTPTRYRNRLVAARMARGFLEKIETGRSPDLPTGMERLSLNELSKYVTSEVSEKDPENVEKRIWRLSLPIIHLAVAFERYANWQSPDSVGIFYDMQNLEMHRAVVALAEELEVHVLANRQFGVKPENLLRIRWQE